MHITSKGQVTIPQNIREKYQITPHSEVAFVEENGRVYLEKIETPRTPFDQIRGILKSKMTTDEILALTRGSEE